MKKVFCILLLLTTLVACEDNVPIEDENLQYPYAVDLGLSVRWASRNIGANSPEEYGDYFAWGETTTKGYFGWETYLHKDFSEDMMGCPATLDDINGTENDAAHINWGDGWRMPTYDEIAELYDKCEWTWTTINEVDGVQVTGPNGSTIFLPAAGVKSGSSVTCQRIQCYYWTSTPIPADQGPNFAYAMDIYKEKADLSLESKLNGIPIRPVID